MAVDFKKPEEVKEYLKNMHIEYKFGCYSEKQPDVCHLLGDFMESIKKDFNAATKIYKKNCDEYNYGRSCTKFGDYSMIGKGCVKNVRVAWDYMKKGCELNDENGCVHAGIFGASFRQGMPIYDENSNLILMDAKTSEPDNVSAQHNDNTKKDANVTRLMSPDGKEVINFATDESQKQIKDRIHFSMGLLEKACDTWKSDKACFYLASIYLGGIDGLVDKDLKKAYKISLNSCEYGNPYACANVSRMHKLGDGVQKNPDLAETFMKRAEELLKELRDTATIKFQQGT